MTDGSDECDPTAQPTDRIATASKPLMENKCRIPVLLEPSDGQRRPRPLKRYRQTKASAFGKTGKVRLAFGDDEIC